MRRGVSQCVVTQKVLGQGTGGRTRDFYRAKKVSRHGLGLDGGYPIKQWEGPGAAFDKGVTSGGSFGAKGMDGGFPVGKYDGLNNKAKDDGSDFLAEAKKFAQKYMGKTADAGSKYVKEFSGLVESTAVTVTPETDSPL